MHVDSTASFTFGPLGIDSHFTCRGNPQILQKTPLQPVCLLPWHGAWTFWCRRRNYYICPAPLQQPPNHPPKLGCRTLALQDTLRPNPLDGLWAASRNNFLPILLQQLKIDLSFIRLYHYTRSIDGEILNRELATNLCVCVSVCLSVCRDLNQCGSLLQLWITAEKVLWNGSRCVLGHLRPSSTQLAAFRFWLECLNESSRGYKELFLACAWIDTIGTDISQS